MNNNTFSRAQFIGNLERSGGSIRARGSIGSSDRVDIFRYTILPGRSFTLRSSESIRGGSFDFSVYFRNPLTGTLSKGSTLRAGPRRNVQSSTALPSFDQSIDFYIRFDNPTGNVRFNLKLTAA
jgi:hypothetical protein